MMASPSRSSRNVRAAFAGALFALSPAVLALSPPPPQPDDQLLPLLYETLGGGNWHNNDGWLDPEVHWCNWYGVVCGEEYFPGFFYFDGLELPDNNLSGEMTEALAELLFVTMTPDFELDLSGNDISGGMYFYPRFTPTVDLSDNQFSGPLPSLGDASALEEDQRLFLDGNAFSGSVPESWSDAKLDRLDLSDNQLSAGHQAAINGIKDANGNGHVYLTGNPFEGELTEAVLSAPLSERDELGAGGGIDICFTNLTVEDPDVREWLAEHHAASGDFDQCLGRARTAIDSTLSGSWYNPDRSGEGVSVMMLENGLPLLYSFSFDLDGNQQWTFEVGTAGEQWAAWDALKETRGTFGEGIRHEEDYTFVRPISRTRFDRVDRDTVNVYRRYTDRRGCGPWGVPVESAGPILCPIDFISDRMDYQRLSHLAGTKCENHSEYQRYSGAWYNPEQSGEGFLIEVLPDDRVVVYWFTYKPGGSGEQAWMTGSGEMATIPPIMPGQPPGIQLTVTLYQPQGTSYGPDFDPQEVDPLEWGELSIGFGPESGHVVFESQFDEFGAGEYPIERLARPMLAECEEGERQ